MKTIWKNLACRIWFISTVLLLVIAIAVNILASVTFYDAVCVVMGKSKIKILGEVSSDYSTDYATKAETLAHGNEITTKVCEEGFVLLKNNGALPLSPNETKVSVFGKNSVDMAVGGSGSGGGVTAEKDIFDSLTESGFTYNPMLVEFYRDNSRSGEGRSPNPDDLDNGGVVTLNEGETPVADYGSTLWNTCTDYNDVALIVITRIGGEGFDLPRNSDGSHSLQLSVNEKALIEKVKTLNFKKVVIVLNVATTMELKELEEDDGVDAILWTGYAGGTGLMALGEIIKGETLDGQPISPSGRTVDTWAADFTKSPVWENFGAALGGDAYLMGGTKLGLGEVQAYFVDYEENIYIGYRYYETAYAEHETGNYDSFIYDDEVVYPFGYGLSYSTFRWTLENSEEVQDFVWNADSSLTFKIKVENTGDFPARDVVELYVTPPYTTGGIEKSAKVLVGFAKTEIIAAGDTDIVEITVESPYDFASYDCYDANGNGFCGYEAEAGEYLFTIGTDAHRAEFSVVTQIASDIRYEYDPVTGTAVKNLYTDNEDESLNSDAQLVNGTLSRADFAGTWPSRRDSEEGGEKDLTGRDDWLNKIISETSDPNRPEQNDAMPEQGVVYEQTIKLESLVGLDYDDPLWDQFMNQLTVTELTDLINRGAFGTYAIARLGIPQTTACDGPVGMVTYGFITDDLGFAADPVVYDTCVYPCEVVLASTWNIDRLYDMGEAIGNEGLIGNERGDGAPYTGWYAPGLNIHRSPFGGRNFEYYSEDSFLSGKMTAAVIEGCASKGVYVTMKHFALNDQETHRAVNGVLTWATEQSMRELYLKVFEIAIKTAKSDGVKAMGVMSSFNRIGTRWTGGDYRLLTTILREEWGFEGLVITDFNTCTHMVVKDMFYAGGDLDLQMAGVRWWSPDAGDATDVTVARRAARNILYVIASSNAMRGDFVLLMPTWQVTMFIVDGVAGILLIGWGAFVIVRAYRKKLPKKMD